MIIIEKNAGQKIPYTAKAGKVTFDDEIMLNLTKYERDCEVHIDICRDPFDSLVIGAVTGASYVAQIDIPARRYAEPEHASEGEGEAPDESAPPEAIPLDMNTVTLTLWAID